jgi:hypothetical protein
MKFGELYENNNTVTCINCGDKVKFPDCYKDCKLHECKNFSSGYCYKQKGCPMGANKEHQLWLNKKY